MFLYLSSFGQANSSTEVDWFILFDQRNVLIKYSKWISRPAAGEV